MKEQRALKSFISFRIAFCLCLLASAAHAQWTAMNPVRKVQQVADGAVFSMGTGTLKIQVCSEAIIRVLYSPTASFPKRSDFVVIKESWPAAKFSVQSNDEAVVLSTSLLKITVTRKGFRLCRLADEYYEFVPEPAAFLRELKGRADLFTF